MYKQVIQRFYFRLFPVKVDTCWNFFTLMSGANEQQICIHFSVFKTKHIYKYILFCWQPLRIQWLITNMFNVRICVYHNIKYSLPSLILLNIFNQLLSAWRRIAFWEVGLNVYVLFRYICFRRLIGFLRLSWLSMCFLTSVLNLSVSLSVCNCWYNCTSYSRNPVSVSEFCTSRTFSHVFVRCTYMCFHLQMNVTRKFV